MLRGAVDIATNQAFEGVGDISARAGISDGKALKVAMHATVGGVIAAATGGDFKVGAIAGGMVEASSGAIDKLETRETRVGVAKTIGAATAFVAKGSTKDINRAAHITGSAREHNRELHNDERQVLMYLSQGRTPEEIEKLKQAAAHLLKANRIPESDNDKAELDAMVKAGEGLQAEQQLLRTTAQHLGLREAFKYSELDDLVDTARERDELISRSISATKARVGYVGAKGLGKASYGLALIAPETGGLGGIAAIGTGTLAALNAQYGLEGAKELLQPYESKEGARVLKSFNEPVKSYAHERAGQALGEIVVHAGGKVLGGIANVALETKAGHRVIRYFKDIVESTTEPKLALSGANNVTSNAKLGNVLKNEVGEAPKISKVEANNVKIEVDNPQFQLKQLASERRNSPGMVTGGDKLPIIGEGDRWLLGTHANAGKMPKQVADQLKGREFKNFDEFRREVWKTVANDPVLSKNFTKGDLVAMRESGVAPRVPKEQILGKTDAYQLHHNTPINQGGNVYDFDNITIVTPKYHKEVLDPKYHKGR
jgi:hypothetical protein